MVSRNNNVDNEECNNVETYYPCEFARNTSIQSVILMANNQDTAKSNVVNDCSSDELWEQLHELNQTITENRNLVNKIQERKIVLSDLLTSYASQSEVKHAPSNSFDSLIYKLNFTRQMTVAFSTIYVEQKSPKDLSDIIHLIDMLRVNKTDDDF